MKSFSFSSTKSIVSEPGAIKHISSLCEQHNIKRPVIVTDGGIVSCGLLAQLEKVLKNTGALQYSVFDKVSQDPAEDIVLAAVDHAKATHSDGVIGFGGGSSMDTAKLVALLANSTQSLSEIYGVDKVKGQRLPLILIPTTAGTGSEVTPISIVTTGETTKAGVVAQQLLPDIALLDGELTLGLPTYVAATTGIDAMVHAIEAYTSAIKKNLYSDMLALQALSLLVTNIKTVVFEGNNIAARQAMLLGACLAGQAFANAPVAAVHALAYPLGGHFHIPHGLSNALVLPHVMRFNASHCAELYSQLGMHLLPDEQVQDCNDTQITEKLIAYLENLMLELGLPRGLSEMKIAYEDLDRLAEDAILQTRLLVNNPKPLTKHDALGIYQQAYSGSKTDGK